MIMPFVRLIAIYIAVGLAIFAFFNRDAVVELVKGSEPEQEMVIVATPTVTPAPSAPVEVAPEITAPVAEPVFAPTTLQITQPVAAPADMDTRLADARQAYWDGDANKSEGLYLGLTSDFPNETAVAGELGNLYYNSGRFNDAANQYFKVGLIALSTGNNAQAMAMIGVLQTIAPEMATNLKARADAQN